jgi:hypothetical protein
MDVREEMSAETREPQGNKNPRLKEAIISEERKDIWEILREDFLIGHSEANSRIFCRVTNYQKLDVVEGSAPSETEEEPARSFSVRRSGNVGAPATLDSFAPTVFGKKKGITVAPLDRLEP